MIEKIMHQIESHEFSALLNVASSFKTFLRAAYKEPVTKELIKQLLDSPKNIWLILQRATELSQNEFDTRYENPWDTALTIYLWALSLVNADAAETAAAFVAQAENCWWATRFANSLLKKKGATINSNFAKLELDTIEAKIPVRPVSNPRIKVSFITYSLGKPVSSGLTRRTVSSTRAEEILQQFSVAWSRRPHRTSRPVDSIARECDTSICKPM